LARILDQRTPFVTTQKIMLTANRHLVFTAGNLLERIDRNRIADAASPAHVHTGPHGLLIHDWAPAARIAWIALSAAAVAD